MVEVYWVKGHIGVEENEKPEEASKDEAERTGTWRCPEQFISLAHIERTISEGKWKEAKH